MEWSWGTISFTKRGSGGDELFIIIYKNGEFWGKKGGGGDGVHLKRKISLS